MFPAVRQEARKTMQTCISVLDNLFQQFWMFLQTPYGAQLCTSLSGILGCLLIIKRGVVPKGRYVVNIAVAFFAVWFIVVFVAAIQNGAVSRFVDYLQPCFAVFCSQ